MQHGMRRQMNATPPRCWREPAAVATIGHRAVRAAHRAGASMATQSATVPDIGSYKNIPVIEVLVKAGETVVKDQALITLESDKATMEVPAPFAGVVTELKVKLGDEVSEGTVVALIEVA